MDKLYIYDPDGSPMFVAPILRSAIYKYTLMGDCYIEIPFEHNIAGEFPKGCHIYYEHRMFSLKATSFPDGLTSKNGYKYTLRFYAPQHRMEDCVIKWSKGNNTETTFELTATLQDIAQLICDNMNSFLGVSTWKVGTIPSKYETVTKHISFDGKSAWDKLPDITSEFDNIEWWVIDNETETTLNFGKLEIGSYEDFIEGDIIKKLPAAKRGEDAEYGTRFYVFGGTQNIPDDYYDNDQGGITNHISEKRLHLPDGQPYIDAFKGMSASDIIEKNIFLDEIFPKNTETITEVTTREAKVDGVTTTYYIITCANTAFKPSMIISSLSAVFTSGSLQGREFSLNTNGDSDLTFNKRFEIYTQREGSGDSSVVIPNEYLRPQVGDTFILTGVKLPNEYVKNAENELLNKALEIISKRCADTNVYECQTNPVFCAKNNKNLQLGQRVKLIGVPFGIDGRNSRIQGFEKKLYNEYDAIYSVGDNRPFSRIQEISYDVHKIKENNDKVFTSQLNQESRLDYTGHIIKDVSDELKSNTDKLENVSIDVKNALSLSTEAQNTANQAKEGVSAVGNEVGSLKTTITATQITANKAQTTADNALSEVGKVSEDSNAKFEVVNTSITNINKDVDALESLIGDEYNIWFEPDTQIGIEPTLSNYPASDWTSDDDYFNHDKDLYYSITLGRAWRFMYNEGSPYWEEITDADTITALTKAQEALDKAQEALDEANSVSYIKGIFGEDNVLDEKAAILGRLIAVKNESEDIVAGLYGGNSAELNASGYADSEYGTLLIFAGSPSADKVSESDFKVYENGRVEIKTGVFTGLTKHKIINIDNSNVNEFFPIATGEDTTSDGNLITRRTLSPDIFKSITRFSHTFTKYSDISIHLPAIYNFVLKDDLGEFTRDDLRELAGNTFYIYNNSSAFIHLCGYTYSEDSSTLIGPVCFADGIIDEGEFAKVTCVLDVISGKEILYWKYAIGRTAPIILNPTNE